MLEKFMEITNKYVQTKEKTLDRQEFRDNLCQICIKYGCATHFYDERIECEDGNSSSTNFKPTYQEDAMIAIDPQQWKIKWWSRQKSIKTSGKWFIQYKCTEKKQCYLVSTNSYFLFKGSKYFEIIVTCSAACVVVYFQY